MKNRKIKNAMSCFSKENFIKIVLIGTIVMLEYFCLQFSCIPSTSRFIQQGSWLLFDFFVLLLANVFLCIILNNWKLVLGMSTVCTVVYSIINHYVVIYHESPIVYSELANFKTALNVASGYDFAVDAVVLRIMVVFAFQMFLLYFFFKQKQQKSIKRWLARVVFFSFGCIMVAVLLFGNNPIKERYTTFWTWEEPVQKYGYVAYAIENIDCSMNQIKIPEGYSQEYLNAIAIKKSDQATLSKASKPNVIFILNETFFDLNVYTEVKTNVDPFKEFYCIEDATFGYAVVPTVAHGTNNSEYELLTSNSMYLLHNEAPFNYLDMSKTKGNIAQYFNSLGYNTYAMHCCPASNYSRNTGYSELGFQNLILGEENFNHVNYNGNRKWLDADNYKDVIDTLSQNKEKPAFIYLLTYQNHGGYTQNEKHHDSVDIQTTHGNLNEEMEEYLSSVSLSSKAIAELVEYFRDIEEPTIICMVGDHAPSFLKDLEPKPEMTLLEQEIAKRTVPYMIWANYDLKSTDVGDIDYVNLTDLSSVVLAKGGFPLTAYQKSILNLRNYVPVRTGNGVLMCSNGTIDNYAESSQYYELINQYLYLEYSNLTGKEYDSSLFELQ